ncbi:hypothetical protein [Paraburkholderia sp. J41]|uniref:hypothetical protein n=1 Tax=Paraburkholderia sp. J41 TaxID=2805433 RepID=UPI002AC363C9|nr:hypothetical protein [Paraburkholderia sp. J41]
MCVDYATFQDTSLIGAGIGMKSIAHLRPAAAKSGKNPGNALFTTRRKASQNILDSGIKSLNNQAGTFFNRLKFEKMPLVSL